MAQSSQSLLKLHVPSDNKATASEQKPCQCFETAMASFQKVEKAAEKLREIGDKMPCEGVQECLSSER